MKGCGSRRDNYDRRMQQEIERLREERGGARPRLLLHACCAPCSSACLERLIPDFAITVYFYDPNIDDPAEYHKRAAEEQRLIRAYDQRLRELLPEKAPSEGEALGLRLPAPEGRGFEPIAFLEGDYRPEDFHRAVRGLEAEPEGGARCTACFQLRLGETARVAREGGYDAFTTTLTISPLKDADRLNAIGREMGERWEVPFLPSDFKKRGGYQRSIELSRVYGLYRQDYCGCGYSKRRGA